jgi:hypothetical protein
VAYERRIDIVTREWTERGATGGGPHAAVVGYFGIVLCVW